MKKSTTSRLNRIFPVALIAGLFLINDPALAQSGQKFATGGNTLSTGEFFGTLNNFPIDVRVNNILRSSFTNTGFNVLGDIHSTNTMVDSILSSWQVIVADAFSVGGNLSVSGNATFNGNATIADTLNIGLLTISGNRISSSTGTVNFNGNDVIKLGTLRANTVDATSYLLSGAPIDFNAIDSNIFNLQSAVGTLQTTTADQQSEIDSIETAVGNITSSQWQTTGTNSISYTGTATVTNLQAGSIGTAQLTISDKFIAPNGEFDTLRAVKRLAVNHNLSLGKDSGSTESDITSRVAPLKIQSDPYIAFDVIMAEGNQSKIGIGMKDGLTAKFNVLGNSQLSGDLNVTGNTNIGGNLTSPGTIEANTINASNINLSGTPFSSQFLSLSGDTMAGNITLASGTSINHSTGNAALTFDGFGNTNTIGLGYNINTPDSAQGLVVIPSGNTQFPNGAVLLGDANPNGEVLITLNGSAGGRLHIKGWEKKTYLINDGGEKITLDGVNGNSLWETTKGLTLATRSGTTFSGNYHLNIQGSTNAQNYYQNDMLVDLVGMQSAVDNLSALQANQQSAIDTLQNEMLNAQSSINNVQVEIDTINDSMETQASLIFAHDSLIANLSDTLSNLSAAQADLNTQYSNLVSSQWQNDTVNTSNIFYSAGNVGIGTSQPSVPLEVSGSIMVTGSNSGGGGGGGGGGTLPAIKSIIIDGGTDRITATSGTIDFVNTSLTTTGNIAATSVVVAGNIQSASITTANLSIIDKIESDTMHARKSLEVNNSLKLVRDTAMMYAEIATKDTAVALMFQKEAQATVEIGEAAPPAPGEARAKLTVVGNTKLDGSVNVSGNISAAGTVSANTFNAQKFSSDTVFITRIMPAVGDSEIHIGDSSIIINGNINSISAYGASRSNWKDLYFQNQNPGTMLFGGTNNTLLNPYFGNAGIGISNPLHKLSVSEQTSNFVSVQLTNSTTGQGQQDGLCMGMFDDNVLFKNFEEGSFTFLNKSGGYFFNQAIFQGGASPNIQFNSNVGIGTSSPSEKLEVASGNVLIKGTNNFSAAGDEAVLYLGDNNHYIKSVWGGGVRIGSFLVPDAVVLMQGDGRVGIGTDYIPTDFKMAVNGKVLAEDVTILLRGDWPDFVYEPGYNRPTLNEKEKYHEKFGHMMYMDSAKEIKKNGLNISKNFVGLTRNVEEVGEDVIVLQKTVVDLNRIVNTQQEQILKQQEQMLKLQKEVDTLKKNK